MTAIAILGAGPAGATVALGLRRLGYEVKVISERRRFPAVEGVSQRVLDGLRQAGLRQALSCVGTSSQRHVLWGSNERSINREYLLERSRFDAALQEDLRAAGVEVVQARVHRVDSAKEGHLVQLENGRSIFVDFLVEARGRQAPLNGGRLRGPETISLLNHWQQTPGKTASAVESVRDGWSWMARLADGSCYWQITLDVANAELPAKDQLMAYSAKRRGESELVHELFGTIQLPVSELSVRSSTAILSHEASGPNWLRVGDAAMAVDPLSGNGIFQSLSSALQAPAVINTILRHPERSALAQRFHQHRVEQLFLRFARTGRDFYALERRWPQRPFWRARSQWPDAVPMHATVDFNQLRIAFAPVIRGDVIDEAEVVISVDQPLGIWHVQGVEVAPVVRALQAGAEEEVVLSGRPVEQQKMLRAWLGGQGYRRLDR